MNQLPIIIMNSESVESMNQLLMMCSRNDWEFIREISESILQRLLSHFAVWIVIGIISLDENTFIDILQHNQIKTEIITTVILVSKIKQQQLYICNTIIHFIVWIVIEVTVFDQNNFINILQENQIKIEIIIKVILVLLIIYQQAQTKDTSCKTQMQADCNNNNILFYPLLFDIIAYSHNHYDYKFTKFIQKQQQKQSYIYTIIVVSISPAKKNEKMKKKTLKNKTRQLKIKGIQKKQQQVNQQHQQQNINSQ